MMETLTTFGVAFAVVAILGGAIYVLRRYEKSRTLLLTAVGMVSTAIAFAADFVGTIDLKEYMEPSTALAVMFFVKAAYGLLRIDTDKPVVKKQ